MCCKNCHPYNTKNLHETRISVVKKKDFKRYGVCVCVCVCETYAVENPRRHVFIFLHQVVHNVYYVFIFLPPGGAQFLHCVYFSSTRWCMMFTVCLFSSTRWRTMFAVCLFFFHWVVRGVYCVFVFLPPGGARCLLCVYFSSTRWCTMAMSKHGSEIKVDPVSHPQENFPCTRLACHNCSAIITAPNEVFTRALSVCKWGS